MARGTKPVRANVYCHTSLVQLCRGLLTTAWIRSNIELRVEEDLRCLDPWAFMSATYSITLQGSRNWGLWGNSICGSTTPRESSRSYYVKRWSLHLH